MEDFMSAASILWLFITAGGAALLAFGLAIGLLTTRRRRDSSVAQRLADAAMWEQYRAEEKSRPDRDAADPPEGEITVTGHGNCLAAVAAQLGLAHEELSDAELDVDDARYPVLTTIRAHKPQTAGRS